MMKSTSIVQVLLVALLLLFVPLTLCSHNTVDHPPIRIGFINSQASLSLDVYIKEGIEFFIKYANHGGGILYPLTILYFFSLHFFSF